MVATLPKVKRREISDDDMARIEIKIKEKVDRFKGPADPQLISGDYHLTACSIAVIDDPPGTATCAPCP
jgi:hypothetical protein